MQRPDPRTFAQASFVVAVVIVVIFSLSLLIGFIQQDWVQIVQQIIWWISLILSSMGAFMGYAAQKDFEKMHVAEQVQQWAKFGLRFNVMYVILFSIIACLFVVISLFRV